MRFAEFIILLVVAGLAVWLIVKSVSSILEDKAEKKWRADFRTLPEGETIIYVAKGEQEIEYSSVAPVENYKARGTNAALERSAEIEVLLDEAELWAKRHAK